jgi:hypothetical protein
VTHFLVAPLVEESDARNPGVGTQSISNSGTRSTFSEIGTWPKSIDGYILGVLLLEELEPTETTPVPAPSPKGARI